MRISVIIVTWNALPLLQRYLPSVVASTYADLEIRLADNASADGSAEWVRAHHPQVKIDTFDANHGYCGGNNRGARQATGDLLLFLNNDVRVEPGWLEPLAARFRAEPDLGILQPKLRSEARPTHFEYAGAAGGWLDRYGYPFCRGRIFDVVEEDLGQYDDACDIFWASGAAFAIRRSLFETLGGFDEDFEFHMEEIDLCWRAQAHGWRVAYEPRSVVYHWGGGSLPAASPRKTYYNFRNNHAMLVKNLPEGRLLRTFLVRSVLDDMALFRLLVTGKWAEAVALVRASWHTLFRSRRHWRKRSPVHPPPPLERLSGLYPGSVVWAHFIRGHRTFRQLP